MATPKKPWANHINIDLSPSSVRTVLVRPLILRCKTNHTTKVAWNGFKTDVCTCPRMANDNTNNRRTSRFLPFNWSHTRLLPDKTKRAITAPIVKVNKV